MLGVLLVNTAGFGQHATSDVRREHDRGDGAGTAGGWQPLRSRWNANEIPSGGSQTTCCAGAGVAHGDVTDRARPSRDALLSDAGSIGAQVPGLVPCLVVALPLDQLLVPCLVAALPLDQFQEGIPVGTVKARVLGEQRRGRARANARHKPPERPTNNHEYELYTRTLVEKGEFRRSKAVHEVTPSGSADMASAPDHLREFAGTADAADRFEKAMLDFVEEHLQDGGCEERTADAKDLKVGLFGDFLESRGHGQFVEWIPEPTGWVLRAVTDNGIIRVPRPVMIMEYVLKVCGTCVHFPHDYHVPMLTG